MPNQSLKTGMQARAPIRISLKAIVRRCHVNQSYVFSEIAAQIHTVNSTTSTGEDVLAVTLDICLYVVRKLQGCPQVNV